MDPVTVTVFVIFGAWVVMSVLSALTEGLGSGLKEITDDYPEQEEKGIPIHRGDLDLPDDVEFVYIVPGTYTIPDGDLTIRDDGSFFGQRSEVNDYGGAAPPTTDHTTIQGRIAENGAITGSFSGTDTHVEVDGEEYRYDVRDVEGTISGQIDADGGYLVEWTGPDPGAQSGQMPTGDISQIFAAALLEIAGGGAA